MLSLITYTLMAIPNKGKWFVIKIVTKFGTQNWYCTTGPPTGFTWGLRGKKLNFKPKYFDTSKWKFTCAPL